MIPQQQCWVQDDPDKSYNESCVKVDPDEIQITSRVHLDRETNQNTCWVQSDPDEI